MGKIFLKTFSILAQIQQKRLHNWWLSFCCFCNITFKIFRRVFPCFKVILTLCLKHVFAVEHTLQENFAGRDEIRTDIVWLLQ